ncbi:MAG: YDG domain-containing protein [Lachnospiraceae bacterium]|nr:YDG domain-containing protein [Lachnospiraceae bacterium]
MSASTSTGSYVIGGSGTSSVKITGGYFADTGATLGVSGTGKVYSCDVESGYEVFSNTDEETVTDYPVYVAELIPVRISGTATYGQTLTVITNGLESITGYQWLRNGETISNATATTYTLTADDVGKKISVKVTYGSDSTETSDTVTVEKATPTVSLETKTATYTGNVISIGAATVTLVNSEVYSGDITYIYYTDQACTIPTTADNSGASDEEEAPVNAGTYYVKASIAEQTNYTAATSDAVILTIISAGLTGVSVSQSGTLTYNGKEQTAVVTTSATTVDDSKVTFTYSTSEGGTYSDTVPALTAAGEYTVYYQAAAANYTTVSGYFTVTIAQKTVTASINGTTTKTYDGTTDVTAEQNLSIELKGVETGDTVTASATGYSYASKDVSSENIITVAGISLDGADADNYTLNGVTTATVAGSITAKALTASINSTDGATGKTYDGTTAVTAEQEQGLSITLDGVVGTETVTASAAGYAYNSADAASADTITASGITLGGDDKSNYTLSNTTATISGTITAKEITVTITPNGGTYGDTITAATAVLSDVIEADKNNVPVTLTYTGTANDGSTTYNGTAVPSEAGSYTVTAAISNSNYKLTETTTAAFTVARAASGLSVGAGTAISKTYKDDAFGLNATWSDKVNATATYVSSNTNVATVDESGTVTIVGAGTATITVSVSETANYNSGSVEVTLTVDKKDNILTVTTSSYNVTYGDGTFDLGASVENGTVTYESSNTAVATVDSNGKVTITGVGSATITLNVAASDNYNAASTKVAVTVNPATPGITLTEKSATYTGKTIAIGAAAVTLVNGETYEETSNGAITYTYYTDENCTTLTGSSGDTTSGAESEGAAPVNAGTYYVKASIAANENYTAVTSEAVTLNITAAKLTVTAADKTIAYGDAAPTYTVTYSGFVTGEDERNLGGTLEFTCAYKQYSDKGSYTITPSGYTSGNYNITYATGTLTVKPKAITVTIAAKNSAYGDAIVELTADDDGGIVNNDKDVYFLSTAAASTSNVGTYDITGTALDENYNITFENGTGAYGITARAITVTIDSRSSIYGDTIETLTASVTDGSIASVDTEAEVYSLSTTASETVSVGSYDITGTTENTNYSITFVNETNTYTITAKELTVTVVVADKAYDGTNTASISSATLNNIANDDSVSLVNGTATFASVNVGTDIAIIFTTDFALSGTEAVLANYTLTQPTGVTASIAAATLTADDFTVTQEDAAAAQQGDDSTVTLTTDETADIHFTGNAIAPTVAAAEDSLATAGDYEVTYGTNTAVGSSTGTVTITGKGNYAGTLVYTFNIVDEEAPTGSLTIGSNTWDSFWSAGVTFSLFYQQMQTVTVETSDNDHVAKTEYCLASKAVTSTEELADAEWTEFSGSFDIEPENCCVVYVKITDNSGNSTVINSDGIVLEATAPVITGLEEGQTYCGDVTFTVADANLSAVTVDGETLTAKEDGSYTIAADNETHVVEAADQAGNSTSVRVTVKKDHTYVYICSGDGATITESCEYCSAVSASVTISVPEGEQIYDGSTHEAVLSYSGTLSGSGMASDDETTSDNETASGGETSSDNETTSGGETTSSDETTSGSESVSGDILSVTYTRDGVQADDTIQAGEYTASITYGGRTASVTYTVSKAKVTVTADDVTRDYGVANPTLTFTITEGTLVDGDTENDLGVTLSTTATKESATGTYAITGTSDSQKYDVTVLEGTLKVAALIELPEQNFPDDGAVHKVEVQESITEVPEAFKDIQELNTVDKIAEKLKEELKMVVSKQDSYTGEDLGIAVYDVALMVSYDGGATWVKATEENFPADGLTVILPYPEGTNKDDYDFTVTHMFTSTAFGKTPGDVESPEVTKTDSGIQVTVTGLSPIAIGWTEIETETETETETESESKPSAPWKHGLIPDADGVFRYYINNVFAKDYVGVVPYDGSLFFIKNGLIDFDANELCLYEDVWYYVSLGQVQLQYTGLAMHDGAWFYITDGILDTTVNGLIPYDGERFLFAAGRLVSEHNGLWLNAASIGGDNKWYFLAEGRVCDVSQVVMYDGAWFVVKNGIFDSSCNGTIEYDGAIFTVVNGQLYG